LQISELAKKLSESHPEAQNGIKTLQNLLPYATKMQTYCINSRVLGMRPKAAL
jgi:hypothetical protein